MEKFQLATVSLLLSLLKLTAHCATIAHKLNETNKPPYTYQQFVKLERFGDARGGSRTAYNPSLARINATWTWHTEVLDSVAIVPSSGQSLSNHMKTHIASMRMDRLKRDKEKVEAIFGAVRRAHENLALLRMGSESPHAGSSPLVTPIEPTLSSEAMPPGLTTTFHGSLDRHRQWHRHVPSPPSPNTKENIITTTTTTTSGSPINSPVSSGASLGSGEYLAKIGVGTPPLPTYMILDTGSDLTWLQCAPCNRCYPQSDPIFRPSASSSFRPLFCTSPLCVSLPLHTCNQSSCMYEVQYGDGSFTVGNLVTEMLTFSGGAVVSGIGIGCGHDNEGRFSVSAGLIGLGSGRMSFPSQLQSDFAYCLPAMGNGGGTLAFGSSNSGDPSSSENTPTDDPQSVSTPLLRNPSMDTFYYIELEGISVGGRRLPIASAIWELSENGEGGVVVDSGTTVTRLEEVAYEALRETFRDAATDLRLVDGGMDIFDTCYDLSGMESVNVPTIDLHLVEMRTDNAPGRIGSKNSAQSTATISLTTANYLIGIDDDATTYCLAFAPSRGLSILGNIQQQGDIKTIETAKHIIIPDTNYDWYW